MTEEPMVWTSKGNLPVAALEYRTHWEETKDYTKFVERYLLDGEVVKESAHVLTRQGFSSEAIASPLAGA
jgi:hypothetical protein